MHIHLCSAYVCHEQFYGFVRLKNVPENSKFQANDMIFQTITLRKFLFHHLRFHGVEANPLFSSSTFFNNTNWYFEQKANTSGHGQCGKFILSYCETGTIVSRNSNIVPCGWFQVEHHKITARFHIIRNLIPFNVIPATMQRQRKENHLVG